MTVPEPASDTTVPPLLMLDAGVVTLVLAVMVPVGTLAIVTLAVVPLVLPVPIAVPALL